MIKIYSSPFCNNCTIVKNYLKSKDIKPEVYTKANLDYYKHHATDGSNSDFAKFTSDEVIEMRNRYVNEDARTIYQDYQDRCSY